MYPITLKVTAENGCTSEITKDLHINEGFTLFIPNIFTPDNNEHNNEWGAFSNELGLIDFKMEVHNRWGQLIWSTTDPKEKWNGQFMNKDCPTGSYIWSAEWTVTGSSDIQRDQGTLNLMR